MRRADHRAQACLSLRDSRISDRWRIHPRIKQLFRELKRLRRISHMDRYDRRFAHLELKSALLQFALEKLRVRPKFLDEPLALRRIQQCKRRLASRRGRWRVRSRKQERPRP